VRSEQQTRECIMQEQSDNPAQRLSIKKQLLNDATAEFPNAEIAKGSKINLLGGMSVTGYFKSPVLGCMRDV
jgi:hypothetical protein